MMTDNETLESRKKELVANLYSSNAPLGIIALKTDLTIASVLKIIDEVESGVHHKLCQYCSSILKRSPQNASESLAC